jgi:hypothetical protein
MSTVREDLERFHHFVDERLARGNDDVSLDELFDQWQDSQSRDEINVAIRRGLADVDAGRHQDVAEAMKVIRHELSLPNS